MKAVCVSYNVSLPELVHATKLGYFQMQFSLTHHEDGALGVTLASVALKPCNTIILLKVIWKEQVLIFKHFV